jgi:hypothetical protein
MATKILLNLPVKNLNQSIDFFTQLGFAFNPSPLTGDRDLHDRGRRYIRHAVDLCQVQDLYAQGNL